MTREFDFVLASVRRFFQPDFPLPSKEGLDPNTILELADQHAVGGFLRDACDSAELKDGGLEAARSNLAVSAELVKLAERFKGERIDFIPLKGPVLGVALYQDKPLKVSSDLDLLVRPADALRAKRMLERIGYRLETVPHWPSEAAYMRNINNQLTFSDSTLWLKLDLHWTLLPGYFKSPFADADVWTRARLVPWGSTHLQTLSPEHQLMFLCAHGAKHLWARLGWLCDLARLIQVEPEIDWSEVFEQTRRTHTTRMISLGLMLSKSLLGIELSPVAASFVNADLQAPALAAKVPNYLRASRPASTVAATTFCVRVLQRNRDRARLVSGMFLQPTEAEYRMLQMPASLYGLYYLLRPMRLAAKYTRRLSGH